MSTTSRSVALECLRRIDHEGAFANLVVPAALARSGLDGRDRAFVSELVYGTTRWRRAADAVIDRFVMTEPDPLVRTVLRMGAYQLLVARVARHAAVSATVDVAPRRARPFVNAVLRRIAVAPEYWSSEAERLSYPDWIFERLTAELGAERAAATLSAMNEPATVTVREDGYVQDRSSQWVAAAVEAGPGDLVLDACAAPGGKATALSATGAAVVAADVADQRARLIAANAARLGVDTMVLVADAAQPPFTPGRFDHVLVDAPCSGLGALRRRPDARWRITEADIADLVALQRRMLDEAVRLVRPGGTLVYSVCTLTAAESIDHPVPHGAAAIAAAPPVGEWEPYGHGWRVLPHEHGTDGMVLLRYRVAP